MMCINGEIKDASKSMASLYMFQASEKGYPDAFFFLVYLVMKVKVFFQVKKNSRILRKSNTIRMYSCYDQFSFNAAKRI